MAETPHNQDAPQPGSVPAQPEATGSKKVNVKVVGGIAAVILVIGLANLHNSTKQVPLANSAMQKPTSPNATQVNSFEAQQRLIARKDAEERQRQAVLAAQNAQLQQEQAFPGPESQDAAPMTPAQRQAMYGTNNPNAPQKTSGQSQAQAEAKQRQLERERQHQEALNSDTVAIDFARTAPASGNANNNTAVEAASADGPADKAVGEDIAQGRPTARPVSAETPPRKDPMGQYDFDGYQGRLYRVFEGTVLEGVLTNHIDGGFSGPMIVMLTTDYYSHDHQQLLLPQGTRLIGQVQSVSGAGQRKLFVTFNRAICPDGFSLDLNKYTGLDPLGTTGLATNVNNHYLSSFAAAAAVGGIGGLAQVGNNGSVLDANTQIRNGISSQTAQESEQILNKFLNRLPVITVKEGSRARVYINQDILIPSYAEHRVDPSL
ncbi:MULTISPECIES: TrbI/VirB10 family protein [Terriglobus]|jgi:type IV secretory pathway VirB10-like protein|uniref:Type IV secretion system protein VirB10 n=2 Tax=Terriglobus TaxID=392733 RepID=A0A1H4W9C3_9BACT|nr:TrbI/VirB10 family protein [Terriglobus roseus]SEC89690.1 type IV secretion system protein VirB10 [Terriglobus roseus]